MHNLNLHRLNLFTLPLRNRNATRQDIISSRSQLFTLPLRNRNLLTVVEAYKMFMPFYLTITESKPKYDLSHIPLTKTFYLTITESKLCTPYCIMHPLLLLFTLPLRNRNIDISHTHSLTSQLFTLPLRNRNIITVLSKKNIGIPFYLTITESKRGYGGFLQDFVYGFLPYHYGIETNVLHKSIFLSIIYYFLPYHYGIETSNCCIKKMLFELTFYLTITESKPFQEPLWK